MSRYEEVVTYDDDGEEVDSYVERVIDEGPYAGEDPPDDYYDERPAADESVPSWASQPPSGFPGSYSMEPPF
ncbi:hypothetical protein ACFV00_15260 [Streptomyces californicus]|uniref:hypothetical protein n=1 Tax=Streptomyces californicus TaxID=67351 RepID=UPI0036B57CE8